MGKGGGAPTQTSSTVQNTNVPEYARPYVENMLGATQQQLFKMDGNQITGFQPYKAYGGTYDEAGNQTAYDPSKAIAGFSPMQQQAMAMANGPEGFAQNVGGYMSPYMQNVVDVQKREAARQSGIMGTQQQAQATQAGAFGGSRDAIQRAERERNLSQQMGDIQAQGSQAAFANAQQQFNTNLGQMNAAGALQQQNQQQAINQAMQDYANAQQYPLMQLGTMSNMLRGLPMQAQTTQQYQAQANPITQGIGAIGTLGSLGSIGKASGGTVKSMASGGITSVPRYDVGGSVEEQLANLPDATLKKEAMESPSQQIRAMAAAILKQRQAGMEAKPQAAETPQGIGAMGADYNANYAGGGIIAFAKGDKVDAEEAARLAKQTEMYVAGAQQAAADQPASQGVPPLLDRNAPAYTPPPVNATRGAFTSKAIPTVPEDYVPGITATPRGGIKLDLPDRDKSPLKDATFGSKEEALDAYRSYINAGNSGPHPRGIAAALPRPASVPIAPEATAVSAPPPLLDKNAPAYVAPPAVARSVVPVAPKAGPAVVPGAVPATPVSAAAAPAGIAAVPAAGATEAANDPLAAIKAAAGKAQTEADKTQEQRYAEMQAARKAQGLDNDEARQKYMQDLMAQKSNLADEANRTNMLRRAQFFAQWGSTPGNTLVAGMAALKDKIPDIIQDAKDQKLALQQADKAIYDLGEATRLEKLGLFDEAGKQKQKAAETAALLQSHLATASANIEHAKLTSAGTVQAAGINAKAHVQAASISATAMENARKEAGKTREQVAALHGVDQERLGLDKVFENLNATKLKDKAYTDAVGTVGLVDKMQSPDNTWLQKKTAAERVIKAKEDFKTILESNALIHDRRVIATPHMAFCSKEAIGDILKTTSENIAAFATGSPVNVVKK